ncbi:uncharacterized protein LOC135839588 isoform X3 [Planococcus citri]|uniref:uncharacterized protein LOC135839588 isoform X3 n=1 Tax=Planococcus citri TaxID=170843 RepID=UPI0031F953B2
MEIDAVDMDHDNSSEKLFVFHESVSTLQNIASHAVALQLWHHYLSRAKSKQIQEKTDDFFRKVFNLAEDCKTESRKVAELLKTPQRIEKMLKKSLKKICSETEPWIDHFHYCIFSGGMSRYCPSNFDPNHIVWRPNGEIDRKESASRILTEGKLNAEQKFVIMCSYGMATELEKFPTNSLSEYFCLLGITDLKVAYWISYHRHDLREIWLKMPDVIRPEDTSINVTMAMESVKLPYAVEYFWNRLSEAEQLAVALRILSHSHMQSKDLRKIMLSTMSYSQQLQLVDQIPIELMTIFSVIDDSTKNCMPENVFTVWTLVKDRITEQQFVKFLGNVLENLTLCEKHMIVMNKVWDTASDRLKKHIAENDPYTIFVPLMFYMAEAYPPSCHRLLMKLLILVNERVRKNLMWSFCDSDSDVIIHRRDTELLNLCLPKESDQLQLKDSIMETDYMSEYCEIKLWFLEFDEVINAVTFFSRNARKSRKFFKKLLESKELEGHAETFILDYENWNKLSNFIDSIFMNYSLTISRLKKQLVSSFSARAVHCWDKKENFSVLVKITEQVFSTEEMKTFKQTLLKQFQEMIFSQNWSRFEGKCFNTFISWCSEDESRIIDLKDIVPIDAFFDDTFRTICSSSNSNFENSLKKLDKFLKYVCVSDEEVELVKIRKYFERDRYWIRQVELIFRDENRRTISNWFLSVKN